MPDRLDSKLIMPLLSALALSHLSGLTVVSETDSTNASMQRLAPDSQHGQAILAEFQSAGRGRRERSWHSPRGRNVYLSLGWQFKSETEQLSALSLAVAVAVCKALSRIGLRGHGVKWPNDILLNGAKLGGILIQVQAVAGSAQNAVIGVGVNVDMPPGGAGTETIEQPWTDIASNLDDAPARISRNRVAACLLDELLICVPLFQAEGFRAFSDDWNSLDLLNGQRVSVFQGGTTATGIARGLNRDGSLLLERVDAAGRVVMQDVHAGEVSVRHA